MSDVMSREHCSDCGGNFGNCRFSKDDEDARVICHACEDALNSPLVQSLRQQLAALAQERNALREVVGILTNAGESLRFCLRFYYASHGYGCNCVPCMRVDKWEQAIKRAMQLLTPSGEAGKGGGA